MASFDTVANIVSEAAIELGLGAVADVYGSQDANVVQLRTLLKSTGKALVFKYAWLQNVKVHTFTTAVDTNEYNLPSDFQSMVDLSAWNRTTTTRMFAATTAQWSTLQASEAAAVLAPIFRIRKSTVEVWPQPPTPDHVWAFEYRSKYWVGLTGTTTATLDAPTANDNVIIIDAFLMTRALKLAFLKAKGFDTSAVQQDYEEALEALMGTNGPAQPLSIDPRYNNWELTIRNVPESGFGFDDQGGLY